MDNYTGYALLPLLWAVLLTGMSGCSDAGDATADAQAPAAADRSAGQSAAPAAVAGPGARAAARSPGERALEWLELSRPTASYHSDPDPVWQARRALEVALAADPRAELPVLLDEARARFKGFGSGRHHAATLGQVAVVAHYLDDGSLERAALEQVHALQQAAFDDAERLAVQGVQVLTRARMADRPGSARAADFQAEFDALLAAGDTPLDVLADLFQYYYEHPDAGALSRLVAIRPDDMTRVKISGRPATQWAVQRLAWWRAWPQLADLLEVPAMRRAFTWNVAVLWAVLAEFEGDPASADRLVELALARLALDGRGDDVLQTERDAARWMRERLAVDDADTARAMFARYPDIAGNRRNPGETQLKGYKREVIAAALIRSGYGDRGDQLLNNGRATLSMPVLIADALADTADWPRLSRHDPRYALSIQLLTYGQQAHSSGWPDWIAGLAERAAAAGQTELAARWLIAATAVDAHPGAAEATARLAADYGDPQTLGQLLPAARTASGRGGLNSRAVNELVRGGMSGQDVLDALNYERSHLAAMNEMGVTLAYGEMGLPMLW